MLPNCYIWELKKIANVHKKAKKISPNPDRKENPALFCADCNVERELPLQVHLNIRFKKRK